MLWICGFRRGKSWKLSVRRNKEWRLANRTWNLAARSKIEWESKDTFRGLVDHLAFTSPSTLDYGNKVVLCTTVSVCVHDMESFDKEFVGVTLTFHVPSLFRYWTKMTMSKDIVVPVEIIAHHQPLNREINNELLLIKRQETHLMPTLIMQSRLGEVLLASKVQYRPH